MLNGHELLVRPRAVSPGIARPQFGRLVTRGYPRTDSVAPMMPATSCFSAESRALTPLRLLIHEVLG